MAIMSHILLKNKNELFLKLGFINAESCMLVIFISHWYYKKTCLFGKYSNRLRYTNTYPIPLYKIPVIFKPNNASLSIVYDLRQFKESA